MLWHTLALLSGEGGAAAAARWIHGEPVADALWLGRAVDARWTRGGRAVDARWRR